MFEGQDNLKFAAYWHSHNTDAFEKFMREYNLSFEKPCDCKACYMSNRTYKMWRSDDPAANDTDEDQEKPCIFTPAFNTLLEIYGIRVAIITDQDNFVVSLPRLQLSIARLIACLQETVNYKGKLVNAGLEYHLVNIGSDKFNYWQGVAYGPAIYSCKKTTCDALEKLSGLFNYHADRVPPPAPNVVAEMVGQQTEG